MILIKPMHPRSLCIAGEVNMLVNQNPCFVSIERKPGFNAWVVYLAKQITRGKIAVVKPTELVFEEHNETDAIEPSFTLYGDPDLENWFESTASAVFNACPHLREKFATKKNDDEVKVLKEHIANLNEIIKSLNPNMDIREKV